MQMSFISSLMAIFWHLKFVNTGPAPLDMTISQGTWAGKKFEAVLVLLKQCIAVLVRESN